MTVTFSPLKSDAGFFSPGFLVTPDGTLILDGELQANSLNIESLSANEILIQGISVFDFEDSAVSLSASVTQSSLTRLGVLEFIALRGDLEFKDIEDNEILRIQNGQVVLSSVEVGSIDNIVIGLNTPADGFFENLEAVTVSVEETIESQQVTTVIVTAETIESSVLKSTSIEVDNVSINLQPTEINHATRKDYVDNRAAALSIALGA